MEHTKDNPKEILIVEEQSIVSLELKNKLVKDGYKVHRGNSFESTKAGLKPDLVISDAALNNPTFIQIIINFCLGKKYLPVICTSMECTDILSHAKKLKIIAYFLKPFNSQDIVDEVNDHFKLPEDE
ncbi:MAG: hypothetical protein M3Q58_04750 [Bacteroidota bacterium]|nr:hypothetical protein [Bacteroidota bacterium]